MYLKTLAVLAPKTWSPKLLISGGFTTTHQRKYLLNETGYLQTKTVFSNYEGFPTFSQNLATHKQLIYKLHARRVVSKPATRL